MSAWHSLIGTPALLAGSAGVVTVPQSGIVVSIVANATSAGSMVMFGQPSVTIPAGTQLSLDFKHALWAATATNGGTITFTGTSSYVVHYVQPQG